MKLTITIPPAVFATIETVAAKRKITPESLVEGLVDKAKPSLRMAAQAIEAKHLQTGMRNRPDLKTQLLAVADPD